MLMTEKVASEKRCTLSLISLVALAVNIEHAVGQSASSPFPLNTYTCIGSKCAQWNWYDYADAEGMTWREPTEEFAKGRASKRPHCFYQPARGYCGLTGSM